MLVFGCGALAGLLSARRAPAPRVSLRNKPQLRPPPREPHGFQLPKVLNSSEDAHPNEMSTFETDEHLQVLALCWWPLSHRLRPYARNFYAVEWQARYSEEQAATL